MAAKTTDLRSTSSSPVEKLRQLVGITSDTESAYQARSAAPTEEELIDLLKKQDLLIAEISQELRMCKAEILELKQLAASTVSEYQGTIESLKEALSSPEKVRGPGGARSDLGMFETFCAQCEENRDWAQKLTLERRELDLQMQKLEKQVSMLAERERTLLTKMRDSIQIAETAQSEGVDLERKLQACQKDLTDLQNQSKQREAEFQAQIASTRANAEVQFRNQIDMLTDKNKQLLTEQVRLEAVVKSVRKQGSESHEQAQLQLSSARRNSLEMQKNLSQMEQKIREMESKNRSLEDQCFALDLQLKRECQQKEKLLGDAKKLRDKMTTADQATSDAKEELLKVTQNWKFAEREKEKFKYNCEIMQARYSLLAQEKRTEIADLMKQIDLKNEGGRAELETLLTAQNQLIARLRSECKAIAGALENSEKHYASELKRLHKKLRKQKRRDIDSFDSVITNFSEQKKVCV